VKDVELLIPEIEKAAMELCRAFAKAQSTNDTIAFLRAKGEFRGRLKYILSETEGQTLGEKPQDQGETGE
jgi:hypothetical protein